VRLSKVFIWLNFTVAVCLLLAAAYGLAVALSAKPGLNESTFVYLSVAFIALLSMLFFITAYSFKRGLRAKWLLQALPFLVVAYGFLRANPL
jgi:hypothetical protein